MDLATLGILVLGFVALVGGAELLVRGSSRLALAFGVSPVVIGLTVVAFGTSSPELAVSLGAVWSGGQDGIALGNVLGSNVFNVLAVIGLSAAVAPLVVAQRIVRLDVPIMIGASVLTVLLALDGRIGRLDGALLFAGGIAYTALTVRMGRRESRAIREEYAQELEAPKRGPKGAAVDVLLSLAGLGLLVLGADWLVDGASGIARQLGVSELVIGLTVVAAGTSLPELATSVLASLRGQRDIAVGNAVGSNIFNLFVVLGPTALVGPRGVEVPTSALRFDLPVMCAVAIACLPVFFTGHRIARWEGFVFAAYYAAYLAFVVLSATGHAAARTLGAAVIWFVLPVTLLTLAVSLARELRARRARS